MHGGACRQRSAVCALSVWCGVCRSDSDCSKSRTVTELTMMAANKKNCKPTWREVWARYQKLYGKEQYDPKVEEEYCENEGADSE